MAGADDGSATCWICLEGSEDGQELVSPCGCPRVCHSGCMARWQLQKAGQEEEHHCRFCKATLADWRPCLTPDACKAELGRVCPTIALRCEGRTVHLQLGAGPDAQRQLLENIRSLFGLPGDQEFTMHFQCKHPLTGELLTLGGLGAFDAAAHCATVSAVERRRRKALAAGGAPVAADPAESALLAAASPTALNCLLPPFMPPSLACVEDSKGDRPQSLLRGLRRVVAGVWHRRSGAAA